MGDDQVSPEWSTVQTCGPISGTEVSFEDGELSLGMMPGSLRARDMQRDAR
jgi:hypothetical protein